VVLLNEIYRLVPQLNIFEFYSLKYGPLTDSTRWCSYGGFFTFFGFMGKSTLKIANLINELRLDPYLLIYKLSKAEKSPSFLFVVHKR
jgi:hypothetical protein